MPQSAHVGSINFSTAFTIDKIAGILSNTFTAGSYNLGGYLYQYTIPHNLTRPAFCDALFSNNNSLFIPNGQNDGSTSYQVYSDASNYYLLTSANTGTIDYKLVATWIDGYDTTNPLITPTFNATLASVNNTTNFDSRANYQKVFSEGVQIVNNPGAGATNSFTITHNLGYQPNYKIFFESLPGQIWPSISGGTQDFWLYDFVHQYECWGVMSTTTLKVFYTAGSGSASTFRVWPRIYYDS